jgi:glycosyltransferase involved in cell wall biosynthesis
MPHVVYDHQVFSWQEYGGISRYFYELAGRVNAFDGFSASIVAPLYVNRYLKNGGMRARGMYLPPLSRGTRAVEFVNRHLESAWLKIRRPDVLHETYYPATSSAPKGCPIVVTVHDMIQEKFSAAFGLSDETSAKKRAAVMRADRVVCVSENTRADLIQIFNPDPGKIRTIHLGVAARTENALTMPPALPKPFFLYVGMRRGYKNFANVLNAYAAQPMLRQEFDLIAFGSNPLTPEEREAIGSLRLAPHQVRHLAGDDDLLGYLYGKAEALIYPSLYEGFGIPPLEAMSHGCPVLCSNTSSIPEVAGNAGLYFDPHSVEAIGDAMDRVASLPSLRSDLAARGRERAKEFSWDRCTARTLDVYRELVS